MSGTRTFSGPSTLCGSKRIAELRHRVASIEHRLTPLQTDRHRSPIHFDEVIIDEKSLIVDSHQPIDHPVVIRQLSAIFKGRRVTLETLPDKRFHLTLRNILADVFYRLDRIMAFPDQLHFLIARGEIILAVEIRNILRIDQRHRLRTSDRSCHDEKRADSRQAQNFRSVHSSSPSPQGISRQRRAAAPVATASPRRREESREGDVNVD